MNNKNQFLKRVYIVSSFLLVAALLLAGCDGTFSIQGSADPNEEGGLDISADVQPDTADEPDAAVQPAGSTGMNQTTIILIVVGIASFILILILVLTRGQSRNEPRT